MALNYLMIFQSMLYYMSFNWIFIYMGRFFLCVGIIILFIKMAKGVIEL